MSPAQLLSDAFVKAFRPAPDVQVSEWADRYRMVGAPSPEKGPWVTGRVPYTRELMDNFSASSDVEITVLRKAAQGAGTEVLLNVLGAFMCTNPDSALLVLPTINSAKKFVRARLDPMIAVTPELARIVSKPRGREGFNTTTMKDFGGHQLMITGANSGPDLRSFPAKLFVGDEINGYPLDLDGEGSSVDLAIQRTAAFHGRKIGLVSTPTVEEVCQITAWYNKGDQRVYMVPCPLCGVEQELVWGSDRIKDGRPGGVRWERNEPATVRYQCEACGDKWEEWRKVEAIERGQWVATAPGNGGGKIRSYQINALYYPYGWPGNSWRNLAAQWEADHADPVRKKTFWNLKLGLPWRDPSEAKADANELMARVETYGPEIPRGVAVLTAGADVQANRIEVELVGWGRNEESWSIEYKVFLGDTSRAASGDPEYPSPWEQLDSWLASEWLSEYGVPLRITAICVDAGYNTHVVAAWCGQRFTRKVWATVGRAGRHPIWPRKPGRSKQARSPIFTVGVDSVKENIYARLKIATPGPGYMHFSKPHNDAGYFEQLTSEIRIPDYTGPIPKFVWQKKRAGARNEVLDCRGLAYAAVSGLQAGSLRLNDEMAALEKLAAAASRPTPKVQPADAMAPGGWFDRAGDGWLSR
jgi:phage terminase large subunit GpA-like protein